MVIGDIWEGVIHPPGEVQDFSKEGQYKAGFASTPTDWVKGSVPNIPDPATAPEPPKSVTAV